MAQDMMTEYDQMVTLPTLVPPVGARPVGVFADGTPEGKIIYEMKVLDVDATVARRRVKIGPDGQPVLRRNAAGVPVQTVYEIPGALFRTKRFILRPFKNKKVKMVENFEESAADRQEREERQAVAAFAQDLAAESVRRGFTSAKAMLDKLFGKEAEPSAELGAMAEDADDLIAHGGVTDEEMAGTQS